MPARSKEARASKAPGFTLIELMVVTAIIAAVLAVALPQFLPAIMYTTHEGAARHLANFGRAAIAHVTFEKEAITVKVDLDAQQYWAERLPEPPEEEANELHQGMQEDRKLPEDDRELFRMAQDALENPQGGRGNDQGSAVLDEQRDRMAEQFDERARQTLTARASRIKQDERFEARDPAASVFSSMTADDAPEPEAVDSPLLGRTTVPEEVRLVRVAVAGKHYEEGVAEIELSPLGLAAEAKFWLMNEDGEMLVVRWDPVTGRASVHEGSES